MTVLHPEPMGLFHPNRRRPKDELCLKCKGSGGFLERLSREGHCHGGEARLQCSECCGTGLVRA